MRHEIIHAIAMTLCECDGKDWQQIIPAERDRYARVAILVDDRIQSLEAQDGAHDDSLALQAPDLTKLRAN